uniref:(California timema) hypothetical protein n=1 Tax=Timema californicum TaxID=61474 RepID=A0A7R9IXI3_TIMCA|nr:unnamed protein product [Timema californicum]
MKTGNNSIYSSPMASLVLTDGFEKLPDQIMYLYAKPYDLQKHVFNVNDGLDKIRYKLYVGTKAKQPISTTNISCRKKAQPVNFPPDSDMAWLGSPPQLNGEMYLHLCGGGVENHFGETPLSTPDRDTNINLPVISSLGYCASMALEQVVIKASNKLITWVISSLWDSQYPPSNLLDRASQKRRNASPSTNSVPADTNRSLHAISKLLNGFGCPVISRDEKASAITGLATTTQRPAIDTPAGVNRQITFYIVISSNSNSTTYASSMASNIQQRIGKVDFKGREPTFAWREGGNYLGTPPPPGSPDRDLNLNFLVPGCLAQHETSALANYAMGAGPKDPNLWVATPSNPQRGQESMVGGSRLRPEAALLWVLSRLAALEPIPHTSSIHYQSMLQFSARDVTLQQMLYSLYIALMPDIIETREHQPQRPKCQSLALLFVFGRALRLLIVGSELVITGCLLGLESHEKVTNF